MPKKYSCGHKKPDLIVSSGTALGISMYLSWKESGTKKWYKCWKEEKK